jgi:hypothetical protein
VEAVDRLEEASDLRAAYRVRSLRGAEQARPQAVLVDSMLARGLRRLDAFDDDVERLARILLDGAGQRCSYVNGGSFLRMV